MKKMVFFNNMTRMTVVVIPTNVEGSRIEDVKVDEILTTTLRASLSG